MNKTKLTQHHLSFFLIRYFLGICIVFSLSLLSFHHFHLALRILFTKKGKKKKKEKKIRKKGTNPWVFKITCSLLVSLFFSLYFIPFLIPILFIFPLFYSIFYSKFYLFSFYFIPFLIPNFNSFSFPSFPYFPFFFCSSMGLCKCRVVTNLFCYQHKQSVCEKCICSDHHTVSRVVQLDFN